MLGHRKLNTQDYTDMLKRRWWVIAIPVILLPIIAYSITFFLPAEYVSQTLVLIEEQKVPDDLVKPVISSSLDSRLASMKEQILSRSRIQPIIERYNLYPSKRGVNNMDDRVDLTRKAISIKPIQSEVNRSGGLPGFFITFKASDAHTAQLVCTDITSLFVTANLQSRELSAEGTTDFLKGQLDDAKRSLDDQDAKLAAFQRQYGGKLPGEEGSNINMLTSLNTQLEASNQALARMQQDKAYQESMLTQQVQNAQATVPTGPTGGGALAPQAEQVELQSLLAQEADLTAHYTADYPDVIAVRRKIADLRKKIAQTPPPAPVTTANALTTAPSRTDTPGIQQLRAQIRSADIGIQNEQRKQMEVQNAIHVYQDRIQSTPQVEEEYKALTRDYETAQKFYDDLLAKMNQSKMATDLEKRQQGEQFTVMDAANLPDAPTFPNPVLFAGAGLGLGLAFGVMLAAFLEYKNTALRTERDIWAFTQLPTLAVIAYSGELTDSPEKSGKAQRLLALFKRKAPHDPLQKAHV